MNTIVEKFLNKISLDERISDGIFEIENNNHLDIFQEYLQNMGASEEESIHARNRMVEGRFPERQAYNKNGILVTFPTPEYKKRAIERGTHFEKNPMAGKTNLQFSPAPTAAPAPAPTASPAPAPTAAPAPAPTAAPAPTTVPVPATTSSAYIDKETKEAQEEYVEKILATESITYTINEANKLNFYKKDKNWYSQDGELIGTQFFDESKNTFLIKK